MNRLGWLALAFSALLCEQAHATPNFPGVIEDVVGTRGPPPCDLCHLGDLTTNYAVRTAFGMSIKARGVVPGDEDSLRTALEQLREQDVDSDRDGVPDITELEAGTDPNVPGDGPAGPQIKYGCSVQAVAAQADPSAFIAAAVIAGTLVVRRRYRPRRAPRRSSGQPS